MLTVNLAQDDTITIDGQQVDQTGFAKRLTDDADTTNTLIVEINADRECELSQIAPLIEACDEIHNVEYRLSPNKAE